MLALCVFALAHGTVPLVRVEAGSLYEAGLRHGRAAAARTRGWLAAQAPLLRWSLAGAGAAAFAALKAAANSAHRSATRAVRDAGHSTASVYSGSAASWWM